MLISTAARVLNNTYNSCSQNGVFLGEEGKGSWTETEPIELYGPDSKPYVEILGLNKSKQYEIATFAVNEKGESEWSDVQTVVPGSPINPTVEVKTTENNGTDSKYFVWTV